MLKKCASLCLVQLMQQDQHGMHTHTNVVLFKHYETIWLLSLGADYIACETCGLLIVQTKLLLHDSLLNLTFYFSLEYNNQEYFKSIRPPYYH